MSVGAQAKESSNLQRRGKAPVFDAIRCPECGCAMSGRVSKNVPGQEFYGCTRFPLCMGKRPKGSSNPVLPNDSLTALLLDAHQNAVKALARPDVLGRDGCIRWWCEVSKNFLKLDVLEDTLDKASKVASQYLPGNIDFIQEAHDWRVTTTRLHASTSVYSHWLERPYIVQMPDPLFTKRWDISHIEQIEITLAMESYGLTVVGEDEQVRANRLAASAERRSKRF